MKQVILASYANGNPVPGNFAVVAGLEAAPQAFPAVFADNSFVGKLLVKVSES